MKKVIVVGSGILGASTAYQLAKRGAEVILVDRGDIGQATDAAAGIICPWLSQRRNQDWYQLAKAGARFYPELIEELQSEGETETGYARVGHSVFIQISKRFAKWRSVPIFEEQMHRKSGTLQCLTKRKPMHVFLYSVQVIIPYILAAQRV